MGPSAILPSIVIVRIDAGGIEYEVARPSRHPKPDGHGHHTPEADRYGVDSPQALRISLRLDHLLNLKAHLDRRAFEGPFQAGEGA